VVMASVICRVLPANSPSRPSTWLWCPNAAGSAVLKGSLVESRRSRYNASMSIQDRPHVQFYEHVPTRPYYALRLQSGRYIGAYGPVSYAAARCLDLEGLDYDADTRPARRRTRKPGGEPRCSCCCSCSGVR
jgi:hypothetical protein